MWPKSNPFTNAKSAAQPHRNGLASAPDVRHGIRLLNQFRCLSLPRGRPGGYAGAIPERSKLSAIKPERLSRLGSGYSEFDRVLGGGFVPGSVILLGGAPGAGKSTLLLQVTTLLSAQKPCLYVTGEESLEQIALRTTFGVEWRAS